MTAPLTRRPAPFTYREYCLLPEDGKRQDRHEAETKGLERTDETTRAQGVLVHEILQARLRDELSGSGGRTARPRRSRLHPEGR